MKKKTNIIKKVVQKYRAYLFLVKTNELIQNFNSKKNLNIRQNVPLIQVK